MVQGVQQTPADQLNGRMRGVLALGQGRLVMCYHTIGFANVYMDVWEDHDWMEGGTVRLFFMTFDGTGIAFQSASVIKGPDLEHLEKMFGPWGRVYLDR